MLVKLLTRYLIPYKALLLGAFALQLVAAIAALYLPNLNARIIDEGVSKGDTATVWRYGLAMVGISFVQIICQSIAIFFGARAAMRFGRDVRHNVFSRVLSFSSQEINLFGAPSLITRNTNDVQQVQQFVMLGTTVMAGAPLMMIGGVVMAFREDIGMSWLVIAAMAVLAISVGMIAGRLTPLFVRSQTRIDNLNRVLREQIGGIRVIRAFNRSELERQRFSNASGDIRDLGFAIGTLFSLLFPLVMLIAHISSVGVVWFGGIRVDEGKLMIGQLTAFLAYLMQILMSVMMATMLLLSLPRAHVCAGRIMDVLSTPSSVTVVPNPISSVPNPAHICFDGVEFTYPGAEEAVLRDVSFEMVPGTTTAIIGSTGSGKTTLVNLIPRLYDTTGGSLTIDGRDVRDLDPDSLWSRIGLVPQSPYLFSGTVASNLRDGKPNATEEEMWQALTWAQATDFVEAMGGLDSFVAQGGTNLSGGQRQRLSIARALIRQPDIYLFDDVFSALDAATDARLRTALATTTATATSLIVAQRVASIRHADQIIVLEAGQIVGIGTHDDLMVSCQTYREIVDSQILEEEVA